MTTANKKIVIEHSLNLRVLGTTISKKHNLLSVGYMAAKLGVYVAWHWIKQVQ